MAIPQGRMSTVPVIGEYLPPEGVSPHPYTTFERGPVDVEDTTKGLLYQDWQLVWEPGTGNFVLTARTTGESYIIGNSFLVTYASFTFDNSGRVTFAWSNDVSSYLYWYDTAQGQTVTDDLGVNVITPTIYLDDKRKTQDTANDMLLWYTKADGLGTYTLYMKEQRDRFLIEYEMATTLESYKITACGMTKELRVQIRLRGRGTIEIAPSGTSIVWAGTDIYANITGAVGQYSLVYFKMNLEWGNPNEATAYVWLNSVAEYYSWLDGQPADNEYWMRVNVLSVSGNPLIVIRDANRNHIPENTPFQMSINGDFDTIFAGIHSSVVGVQSATITIEICRDNGSGSPDNVWVLRTAHCEVTITP